MSLEGTSSVLIDAPIAECKAVVDDLERAKEWQQSIKDGIALERDGQGRATVVDAQFDAIVSTAKVRLAVTYAEDGNTVRRVSGDLKSVDATWTLEALGELQTRATYTIDLDPGRVLGMLIRGPAAGQLRKLLVEQPPKGLRAHVESRA